VSGNSKECTPRASNALVYKTGQFSGDASALGCIYHDGSQDATTPSSKNQSSAQILNSGITFGAASYSFSMLVKINNDVDQTDKGYFICGPISSVLFIGMWGKSFQTWNGNSAWAGSNVPSKMVDVRTGSPWVHLCMTYNTSGTRLEAYLNGKSIGGTSNAQAPSSSQTVFIGGSEQNDYCTQLYIADIRGWASALTAAEVANMTTIFRARYQLSLTEPS
jgi:hypothetical protein